MDYKSRLSAPLALTTPTGSTTNPTTERAKSPIGTTISAQEVKQPAIAASFFQYCATFAAVWTPPSLLPSPQALCPHNHPTDFGPSSPRLILPNRIPTGASPASTTSSSSSTSSILIDLHIAELNLDPTKWKPKLHHRGISTNSKAFRYLSPSHQHSIANSDKMVAIERIQRPTLNKDQHRSSTTSMTSLNTSTTHTTTLNLPLNPTTTSSSLSASCVDCCDVIYDFKIRPLPPRHDPSYYSSAGAAKGIDLVTPHVVAPPAADAVAAPVMAGSASHQVHLHGREWEKQTVKKLPKSHVEGDGREGLGALFGSSVEK